MGGDPPDFVPTELPSTLPARCSNTGKHRKRETRVDTVRAYAALIAQVYFYPPIRKRKSSRDRNRDNMLFSRKSVWVSFMEALAAASISFLT